MNVRRKSRRRLEVLGVGATPLALIFLVRMAAPGAPAVAPAGHASAAPPASLPSAGASSEPVLSAVQKRALAWSRSQGDKPLASPMDHPPAQAAPIAVKPVAPAAPKPTVEAEAAPTLSAIVGRGQSARVLIDGQVMALGDSTPKGWKVQGIDPKKHSVTLRHADGRVVEITNTPGRR